MATEFLKCVLTEEEIKSAGMELALSNSKVDDLEAQKKSFNDQIKADITMCESQIQKYSRMIQNGYEYRNVEVTEEVDQKGQVVNIFRTDTGEFVRSRPLKNGDVQEKMFDEGGE